MSHRALVAVARGDGRYEVRYAHEAGADHRIRRLLAPGSRAPRDLLAGPLLARGLPFEDVVDRLDPVEHEALLVVETDGEVTPHVVLPYVLATADGLVESAPRGAVLALVGRDGGYLDPSYVRGWFHGATEVLGQTVDVGLLSPAEALGWLDDAVHRLAGDRHPLAVVP